ncbi:MAG: VOC family protein [Kineosporiaceae bacterium]
MTDTAPAATTELPRHHPWAPRGYRTLTPFLPVPAGTGAAAIDFLVAAFGAQVISRMDGEDGVVWHSELLLGDGIVQVGDEIPSMGLLAGDGKSVHGSYVLYVEDVDAVTARAVESGATLMSGPEDVFSGDRMSAVLTPTGHRFVLLTHLEDVSAEEVERRAREWMASGGQ